MRKLSQKEKEILHEVIKKCFGTERWVLYAFDDTQNAMVGHHVALGDIERIKKIVETDIKFHLDKTHPSTHGYESTGGKSASKSKNHDIMKKLTDIPGEHGSNLNNSKGDLSQLLKAIENADEVKVEVIKVELGDKKGKKFSIGGNGFNLENVQEEPKAQPKKYEMEKAKLLALTRQIPKERTAKINGTTFSVRDLYNTLYNADLPHDLELNNVKMTKDDIAKAIKLDLKSLRKVEKAE